VVVDVTDEGHFSFLGDAQVEVDGDLSRAFWLLRHLQPDALASYSLKIGGESPELIALERRHVVESHDQRGVNFVEHYWRQSCS
jgi:hypothetical protein